MPSNPNRVEGLCILSSEVRDDVVVTDDLPDICPRCGQSTIHGYGYAGGGFGPYVVCSADDCGFLAKTPLEDEDA